MSLRVYKITNPSGMDYDQMGLLNPLKQQPDGSYVGLFRQMLGTNAWQTFEASFTAAQVAAWQEEHDGSYPFEEFVLLKWCLLNKIPAGELAPIDKGA